MATESEFIDLLNYQSKIENPDFQGYRKSKVNLVPEGNFDISFQPIFSLVFNYAFEDEIYDFDLVYFGSEVLESEPYFMFGKNLIHGLDYVLDKGTKQVHLLSDEGNIDYHCSSDVGSFLIVCCHLLELEIKYSEPGDVDEKTIDDFREKCIETAGGETYREYYELIV